jgi:hypothetical protein
MTASPLQTFASQPIMVRLALELAAHDLDAVIILRGRKPGAGVQVLGLSLLNEDGLRSLVEAAQAAIATGQRPDRFDPTASAG